MGSQFIHEIPLLTQYCSIQSSGHTRVNIHHLNSLTTPDPIPSGPPVSTRNRSNTGHQAQPLARPSCHDVPGPAQRPASSTSDDNVKTTRPGTAEPELCASVEYGPADYGLKGPMTMTPFGMFTLGPRGWESVPMQQMYYSPTYGQQFYPQQPFWYPP